MNGSGTAGVTITTITVTVFFRKLRILQFELKPGYKDDLRVTVMVIFMLLPLYCYCYIIVLPLQLHYNNRHTFLYIYLNHVYRWSILLLEDHLRK